MPVVFTTTHRKYIYRVLGGFATPYQLANLPTNAHFGPRRTSPAPPPNWPISPPARRPPPPGPPTMPTDRPRGTSPAPGPPGMMPPGLAPRASGSAARLARPPRAPPPSTTHSVRRSGQLPRPRQLAPHAPFPIPPLWGPKPRRRPPHPGAEGLRTARGAWWRGRRGAGGSCCEGHPARAPTVRSPAAPALTQRNATTVTDPQSPNPGPLGPGRFYTDSPTPFGV